MAAELRAAWVRARPEPGVPVQARTFPGVRGPGHYASAYPKLTFVDITLPVRCRTEQQAVEASIAGMAATAERFSVDWKRIGD